MTVRTFAWKDAYWALLPRRAGPQDTESRCLQFEEFLPIDVDLVHCCFIDADPDHLLAVALPHHHLQALLDPLSKTAPLVQVRPDALPPFLADRLPEGLVERVNFLHGRWEPPAQRARRNRQRLGWGVVATLAVAVIFLRGEREAYRLSRETQTLDQQTDLAAHNAIANLSDGTRTQDDRLRLLLAYRRLQGSGTAGTLTMHLPQLLDPLLVRLAPQEAYQLLEVSANQSRIQVRLQMPRGDGIAGFTEQLGTLDSPGGTWGQDPPAITTRGPQTLVTLTWRRAADSR